ncbi:VOC family protein [Dyella sp. GSA-30]|uniref:VOC family protein n=1 Tax=Dyella sp. GSA-30 TaxID=2994496 RepID=UPI002490D86F|nr:VOC family protein [Dyella sp. GSA-30]BDU20004.1 hypothetical protein DYGSA30_14610 [Dyella sp. GSA-30]
MRRLLLCSVFAVSYLFGTQNTGAEPNETPPAAGLSHVPVAVKNLSEASADFARLGFVLKPGHLHDDGIQNNHVKFPDGTEIELISASRTVDSITASYVTFLARGDGPAFLALYAPDLQRVAAWLDKAQLQYTREDGLISLAENGPHPDIFFAGLNHSPTDLPRYFQHPNGATRLLAVWMVGKDFVAERSLFRGLGATSATSVTRMPKKTSVETMRFKQGEIRLLPMSYQVVPGHRIVGVTVQTSDLGKVRRSLRAAGLGIPPEITSSDGKSLFVPPTLARGMWIEFRETKP